MSNSNSSSNIISSLFLDSCVSKLRKKCHTLNLPEAYVEAKFKSILQELGLDAPFPKLSIIAMKGPPFTRKTEFGTLIAASLGCPILSFEHFLGVLQPPVSQERKDEAFRIICSMAQHHLYKGVSKNVVIDSPLSSTWHLSQLTTVASSLSPMPARVVIVEFKPVNVYLWRMKFEQRLARHPPSPREWYKPRSWEDVEKAIEVNEDYDERSVQGCRGLVSKLVVDPLLDHPIDDITAKIFHFHLSPSTNRLVEAVKYMITRDEGDDVVVYHQWQQQSSSSPSPSPTPDGQNDVGSLNSGLYCSSHGHNIIASKLEHKANCTACQKQVMRSDGQVSYNCKDCSLALHKECAESFESNNTSKSPFPWGHFSPKYHFPEEFACNPCKGSGKGFSDKCTSCLFETHLKCRLMPTVIRHSDTEEHLLTIWLLPAAVDNEVYRCVACGASDKYNMYLCKICGATYHYKCVTLGRRVKHVHGGHHHHLSLRFSSEEAEDYVCNECHELRDPMLWFYSCEDCPYELHPSCVHQASYDECQPLFNNPQDFVTRVRARAAAQAITALVHRALMKPTTKESPNQSPPLLVWTITE